MMLNDYECPTHGTFEASHPICPALGCSERKIAKIFLKAPGVRSQMTARTDASVKKTAEMYRLSDIASPRAGEASKAGNQADKVLWGDKGEALLGRPLVQAAAPATYQIRTPQGVRTVRDDGGIKQIIRPEIISDVLPPAEKTGHIADRKRKP